MTNGARRPRRQRPLAPRGVCIGVGAVLSATGGTLLTVAAAGVLGGGALVTTAFAGGPPHAAVQSVARPAHVAVPLPAPPAPAAAPAQNPPVVAPAANPPAVGGASDHGGSGSARVTASAPAPAPAAPITAAPPPAPPVTAAPPPPAHSAARAIAIPVTGAAGGRRATGTALLGAGALLIAGSLRRRPRRPPRPFDDEPPLLVALRAARARSPGRGYRKYEGGLGSDRWCILSPFGQARGGATRAIFAPGAHMQPAQRDIGDCRCTLCTGR